MSSRDGSYFVRRHQLSAAGQQENVIEQRIDYVIGSNGSNKIDIPCAANGGNLCAKRFGDLHGEGSDTSSRAVD